MERYPDKLTPPDQLEYIKNALALAGIVQGDCMRVKVENKNYEGLYYDFFFFSETRKAYYLVTKNADNVQLSFEVKRGLAIFKAPKTKIK